MKSSSSIWSPKPTNLFTFKSPSKSKNISKKNMTWPQAKMRYPKMNPFGDADKDKVPNYMDCRPFNKKKHGIVSNVINLGKSAVAGAVAPVQAVVQKVSPYIQKAAQAEVAGVKKLAGYEVSGIKKVAETIQKAVPYIVPTPTPIPTKTIVAPGKLIVEKTSTGTIVGRVYIPANKVAAITKTLSAPQTVSSGITKTVSAPQKAVSSPINAKDKVGIVSSGPITRLPYISELPKPGIHIPIPKPGDPGWRPGMPVPPKPTPPLPPGWPPGRPGRPLPPGWRPPIRPIPPRHKYPVRPLKEQ